MRTTTPIPVFAMLCVSAAIFATTAVRAQVSCNEVGNHVIKVAKAQGSDQLVDCESARVSKQARHKLVWQASGKDTLSIVFPSGANPFLRFRCTNRKSCTADRIDPKARGEFKYTAILNSGGQTFREDPGVIIEP